MLRRGFIYILLLFLSSPAFADPILILLLRVMRDQAISTSIERGVGALRQESSPQTPAIGYALPAPQSPHGAEEQRLRILIDQSFLHLTAVQRDAVFAGMQKILSDKQYAQVKPQIISEFAMKARAVRDSYLSLDKLTYAEKRTLAVQAKEDYTRLPTAEREYLLEMLQTGMLPVPGDLSAIMLAEFRSIPLVTYSLRGPN